MFGSKRRKAAAADGQTIGCRTIAGLGQPSTIVGSDERSPARPVAQTDTRRTRPCSASCRPRSATGRPSRSAATTTPRRGVPRRRARTRRRDRCARCSSTTTAREDAVAPEGRLDTRHRAAAAATSHRSTAGGEPPPAAVAASIGGVVLVVVIAVLAVLGSSLFAVDTVTVTGNVYTDADELAGGRRRPAWAPRCCSSTPPRPRQQLEAIPWVEDARVSTSFPNSASIEIRERTPLVAMARRRTGSSRVLDRDGRVLDSIEGQPVALVWISGPGTLDTARRRVRPRSATRRPRRWSRSSPRRSGRGSSR